MNRCTFCCRVVTTSPTNDLGVKMSLGSREPSSVPPVLRERGESAARKLYRETLAHGGSTVELATMTVPGKTNGYFVGGSTDYKGDRIATVEIPEHAFRMAATKADRLGWHIAQTYINLLTTAEYEAGVLPIGYLGTWLHEGVVYVDAVDWVETLEEAVQLGLSRGEVAVYDVAADGSLMLAEYAVAVAMVA